MLKRERSSLNLGPPLHDFMEFSRLMGFEDVWEFERRFADSP